MIAGVVCGGAVNPGPGVAVVTCAPVPVAVPAALCKEVGTVSSRSMSRPEILERLGGSERGRMSVPSRPQRVQRNVKPTRHLA